MANSIFRNIFEKKLWPDLQLMIITKFLVNLEKQKEILGIFNVK